VDDSLKKSIRDKILANARGDNYNLDDIIDRSGNIIKDVYRANNSQEDAMGQLALEQFKGRVPNKGDSRTKVHDFIDEIMHQFVPDSKAMTLMKDKFGDPDANGMVTEGMFNPRLNTIQLTPTDDRSRLTSKVIHEGLHERDLRNNDYGDMVENLTSGPTFNKKISSLAPELVDEAGNVLNSRSFKDIIKHADLNDLKELLLKGHHGLKRGATIARSNIPRMLKEMPLLGATIGLGTAAYTGDSSAAVPVLNEADNAGDPNEDRLMQGESAQDQQLKKLQNADVPDHVKLKALELFKKNKLY